MGQIAWAETLAAAKERATGGRLLFTYIFSPG